MVIKTMQVFYGADCLPYKDKERQVHYPIVDPAFQGSSQVNEIKFYIDEMGGSEAQWLAVAKLPNGKVGSKLLTTYSDENGNYALLELSSWFTQAKGDLYISLRGYDGGAIIEYDSETGLYTINQQPIIQSTGAIKITIRYSTPLLEEDDEIGEITTQEILAAIGGKLSKDDGAYYKVVSSISNINDSIYFGYLNAGDIVLSKADNKTYQLSGEYPLLTYSQYILENNQVHRSGNEVISGNKYFTSAIYSGSGTTYGQYGSIYLRLHNESGVETVDLTLNSYSDFNFALTKGSTTKVLYLPFEAGTLATKSYVDGFAKSLELSLDSSTYVMTAILKDANGNVLSTQTIDLPLESVVVGGSYDDTTETIILTLNNGNTISIPVSGLVEGLVNTSFTIAGIDMEDNITAQELTNALVFATDSDIESIMED